MTEMTLCILLRGTPPEQVLLGFKKEGFGANKYTGFGGKVEAGETPIRAAIREMKEEAGVTVRKEDLHPVGELSFLFPVRPAWSQRVHVFVTWRWEGEIRESREMRPSWFPVSDIPFDEMWQDGRHWLPPILAGGRIWARFTFREDNEAIHEMEIEEWGSRS